MSTSCLRVSRNHDSRKKPSGLNPPAKNSVFNSVKDTTSSGLATPEGRRILFHPKHVRQASVERVHVDRK
jgi:hypothetical protein